MPNAAWGIDVGNRALKAVRLVREEGRIKVDEFEVIENEQVLSMAGDNRESLIQAVLAQFAQRHATKGQSLAIGVSGQQSFARFIKLPPVEPGRIPQIVQFEAVQQIPFPLDDVEWAYQLFKQNDSPDIEVGIFAMKKDLVNRHIGFFAPLGGNVDVVQMGPLAVYNAMVHDGRVTEPTMFMDMGAENTDLIIADGATVWLRTLPIGGNAFTDTLAKMFKLGFAKAEELKRNAATSKYAKQIFQAMRPVFADLVAEIQRSIGFYATVHRESRIGKIVVLGSTFQLPGLQKYLQQNLQLPIEKLDSFTAEKPEEAKAAAAFSEHTPTLATAYGLALQALGEGSINSSLLPENIVRAKMWREKTKWFAAAAAVVLLGTLAAGGSSYYHQMMYDQQKETRDANRKTLNEGRGLVDQWKNNVENAGESARITLAQLQSLENNRETWTQILGGLLSAPPPLDIAKAKKLARADRELIFIDQIRAVYRPDLRSALGQGGDRMNLLAEEVAMSQDPLGGAGVGAGRFGGGVAAPHDPNTAQDADVDRKGADRGYLILIQGHTPHDLKARVNADFLERKFVANLTKLNAASRLKAGEKWYVAKAEVVGIGPRVQPKPAAGGAIGQPIGGRGGILARTDASINIPADDPDLKVDLSAAAREAGSKVGGQGGMGGAFMGGVGAGGGLPAGAVPAEIENSDRFFPGEVFDKDTSFKVLVIVGLNPSEPKPPAPAN